MTLTSALRVRGERQTGGPSFKEVNPMDTIEAMAQRERLTALVR